MSRMREKSEKAPSDLGRRVASLRRAAGIGARTLSLRIGATHSVIAQLESGDIQDLRSSLALPLARSLGVTVEFLLTGEGKAPTPEQVRAAFDSAPSEAGPQPPATRAA